MIYLLTINYKNVYETNEFGTKQWVLILYDISNNHYVGIPIYSEEKENSTYILSLNKYVIFSETRDFSRSNMNRCIYINGKPLKISNKNYLKLIEDCKKYYVSYLEKNTENNYDGLSYIKWCKDKLDFNKSEVTKVELKQGGIYWINMGYNIGSELRKLRPGILWRCSGDKKLWTIIPLTTKNRLDNYYFHYDLECLKEGSAKIENIMNYSYKRVISPYFSNHVLAFITKTDYENIKQIISKYYLFN